MMENQQKYIDKIGSLTEMLVKSEVILKESSKDVNAALIIAKKNNKSEIEKNKVIEIVKKIAEFMYKNRNTIKKVALAVATVVTLLA